jgi:hypothetical protein
MVLKIWIVRPVFEEAGCHACEKLYSSERVVGEVISSRGSPIASTKL